MTRLPGAIWRPISRNYTNRRRTRTNACINHVDAGNATSLHGWFSNPAARASSHLFVKRGTPAQIANGQRADIEQYIDLDLISWCNGKGDARAVTVETAGYGHGEWDPAQQAALVYIWQFVHNHYGVPLTLMRDSKPATAGIGYHLLGVPGNATQKRAGVSQTGGELWSSSVGKICPGPDRIRQMPALVARAAGSHPTTVTVSEEDDMTPEQAKRLEYIERITIENQRRIGEVAAQVWEHVLPATDGGGVSVGKESAATRLAAVRRSTHQLRSRTGNVLDAITSIDPAEVDAKTLAAELAAALPRDIAAQVAAELTITTKEN